MNKAIDFRVRPPLRGFLNLALFREAERRDRYTRSLGFVHLLKQ